MGLTCSGITRSKRSSSEQNPTPGTSVGAVSSVDLMRPDPDEPVSRPGSDNDTTKKEKGSSLTWPYTNSRAATHPSDEGDLPLKVRRPALYEEYWAS